MRDERRGAQKGAQRHAEGQHGERAHDHLIEELQSGPSGEGAARQEQQAVPGRHRLYEDRQQHDEADKNSEKNRLKREIESRGLDRDQHQVPGAREARRDD